MAAGYLNHEVAQPPWMVSKADDDRRAAGRAPLMQFIDVGDADVGSGGGVDAGGRGPHQRKPHRVAPQQYQAHFGLVYLDLESEHLTQESGSGRKIVNLQVGPTAQELSHRNMLRPHWSPPSASPIYVATRLAALARQKDVTGRRALPQARARQGNGQG